MIFSSAFACIGQMFWKLSIQNEIFFLLIGFSFYAIGAFLMISAYHFGSLSSLQPILSISYVLALFIGYFVFNETISILRFVGVLMIICGVVLISKGN